MSRVIEVDIEGTGARFALREDLAPETAAALWDTLPINTTIRHGKLSGDACFCNISHGPLASLPERPRPELPVTSIYKGWIVAYPMPARSMTELLISYGIAEYRQSTGREYVTPVAELLGDGVALFEKLQQTYHEGEKTVTIRQV
jgi:hypothetical protein